MALRLISAHEGDTTLASEMRRLIDSLAALHERLVSLAQIASAKLVALRAADVATLESLSATEVAELESLRSCDADREAILAGLAQHLPGLPGPLPKLAALADRLPEPLASQLRAKNEGLRAAARKLEEKNRLVADVAACLPTWPAPIRSRWCTDAPAGMTRGSREAGWTRWDNHGTARTIIPDRPQRALLLSGGALDHWPEHRQHRQPRLRPAERPTHGHRGRSHLRRHARRRRRALEVAPARR
jgi:hypothetical protein